MPGRGIGHLDRAGRRKCRPDKGTNLTGWMVEIVGMRRAFVPVPLMVRRRSEVGSLGRSVREMFLVGGGVDRGQRLVEQHRDKSEQAGQPVKAGRALSRDKRVSA